MQLRHFFHHFPHFGKLFEDFIDFLHPSAAPHGDALATAAVEKVDVGAFFGCHRANDGLYMLDLFAVEVNVHTFQLFFDISHPRQHP